MEALVEQPGTSHGILSWVLACFLYSVSLIGINIEKDSHLNLALDENSCEQVEHRCASLGWIAMASVRSKTGGSIIEGAGLDHEECVGDSSDGRLRDCDAGESDGIVEMLWVDGHVLVRADEGDAY